MLSGLAVLMILLAVYWRPRSLVLKWGVLVAVAFIGVAIRRYYAS